MELAFATVEAIHDLRRDAVLKRAMRDVGISAKAVALSAVGRSMTGGLQVPVWSDGHIVDVCAFSLGRPADWSLMTMRGRVLGDDVLRDHQFNVDAPPIYLHPNPLEWLLHDCIGVVALFPSTLPAELIGVRDVVVSEAVAPRLHAVLERGKLANPKILVRDQEKALAI